MTQLRDDLVPSIFLGCEGRDLGSANGKLNLVQIGIGEHVYLVDVIACELCATWGWSHDPRHCTAEQFQHFWGGQRVQRLHQT